ncbi:energy transducer TonB [Mariniflexile gromovii]|uniref:Energy transducer TonB n=1 Tax=Mariniflexile gromovii TaxID=362523 RepID=A0ABS4BSD1_9FLAO|nr:energy transducer TonB [Mariniflexile gromovii]MBP0903494.1 energy transducer TonB [Mariniflexile gromovii]
MKYFETKHERDSAKLTALISVIILLLLFVVGTKYMDPPEEYGMEVNFGTTDFGSGTVQPLKPIKSEPVNINKPAEVEPTKAEPTKAAETKEEVLTSDNSEEIAIKKQKAIEAKAKADADAKAKAEAERVAKEKRELDEKKKKLDALIGGVSKSEGTASGGEGDDNKAGDKGQLDGDPYAPSYFGSGGAGSGGVGYGLNGRGSASYQTLKQDCNESGMVIVRIVVNRAGNVIEAEPGVRGTTNTAACLLEPAKKIALSHKWRPDPNAPTKQIGFVKVNFKLGQ